MATNIQIPNARGLTGGSTATNRQERVNNVKSEIDKNIDATQARQILLDISAQGRHLQGHLRLDGSGGKNNGNLQFSARSNATLRSAKTEVTGAALKALFEKAQLPTSALDQYLKGPPGRSAPSKISNREISAIIDKSVQQQAREKLQASLGQFRTVSYGGREVGGGARPHGAYIKSGSQSETLENIRAGFGTLLSIDNSSATKDMQAAIPNGLVSQGGPNYEIEDFKAPSVETLTRIRAFVDSEHQAGRDVMLHCGYGIGRTGTALAALVLADEVKRAKAANPNLSLASISAAVQAGEHDSIELAYDDKGREQLSTGVVPRLVANAIRTVREADARAGVPPPGSVETPLQLNSLMLYLAHLVEQR